MQICKNVKISALIIFLMFSLLLPAGKILAADPAVTEPTEGCQIKPGEECQKDTDGDGFDDIRIKNITAAGGAPKLITRSLKIKSIGGSQFIESPGIANYIASIYKYAVGLITILTTIMIIISGVMWITSAGNPEKINKAKQMIARSLTGLIIALGSYTLLHTINPDLVEFRALQVMRIEKSAILTPEDDRMLEIENSSETPSALTNLADLKDIPNVTFNKGVDGRATSETRMALASAMEQFKTYNSGGIIITSAVRTPKKQYDILSNKCGCASFPDVLLPRLEKEKVKKITWDGKEGTAPLQNYCTDTLTNPKECDVAWKWFEFEVEGNVFKFPLRSHLSGTALDIHAAKNLAYTQCGNPAVVNNQNILTSQGVNKNTYTTGKITDWCIPKEQQKLIKAMLDNNFCVGLKAGSNLRESWHFELVRSGKNSSFCTKDLNDENLKKLYYTQDPKAN